MFYFFSLKDKNKWTNGYAPLSFSIKKDCGFIDEAQNILN